VRRMAMALGGQEGRWAGEGGVAGSASHSGPRLVIPYGRTNWGGMLGQSGCSSCTSPHGNCSRRSDRGIRVTLLRRASDGTTARGALTALARVGASVA